jgi:hypothetical protein
MKIADFIPFKSAKLSLLADHPRARVFQLQGIMGREEKSPAY